MHVFGCLQDLECPESESDDDALQTIQPLPTRSSSQSSASTQPTDTARSSPLPVASTFSDSDQDSSEDYTSESDVDEAVKPKRRRSVRVKWSAEELNSLHKAFRSFIVNNTQPGYGDCRQDKKKFPCLQRRSLAQIKARFIYLQKKKKNI